jgi:hypothetical protein
VVEERVTPTESKLRRQMLVPPIAAIVYGKFHPLQWNIGSVHRYLVLSAAIPPNPRVFPRAVKYLHEIEEHTERAQQVEKSIVTNMRNELRRAS